jgi:hypothetical protein
MLKEVNNPKLPILVQGKEGWRHTRKGATLQNSQNIKVDVVIAIVKGLCLLQWCFLPLMIEKLDVMMVMMWNTPKN